jgi:3-methyl-2-oxobutanoate hydroxymethyltransferase
VEQRRKPTVADLLETRHTCQRTSLFVTTVDEIAAAEAAGIDMVTTGDDLMSDAMRAAAPTTFIIAALAYGRLVTTEDYLRAGFEMYRLGADAVYCAAGTATQAALAAEGLPVVGHVGFIPTHRTWTGGYRAVGKTAASAARVWQQVRALEDAGAFAAEIELVPEPVAAAIAQRSSLFLVSMGSGRGCAAQYLFSMDVLGEHDGHYPRHSKTYRDFRAEYARLQQERIAAYGEFAADVANGGYPAEQHRLGIAEHELDAFLAMLDADEDPSPTAR